MKGIIKKTFRIYREQLGKFMALSALLIGVIQVVLQWLSESMQGMMSQNSDLFYYLYAALNKISLQQVLQPEVDVASLNVGKMMGMFMLVMVVSFTYSIFISPIYSWATIKLTQKPQAVGTVFQKLKGSYWSLVLVTLCQMVYMMGAGTAVAIIYFICVIPIAILAGLTMTGAANIGLIIAFVVTIIVCILLVLAVIAVISILALFIYPSFIIDDQRNFNAVGRSMKVGWSKFWPILGKYMIMMLIVGLIAIVLAGVFALPILIANTYYSWLWLGYIFVVSAITSPLAIILATLMYQQLSPEIPLKAKKEIATNEIKLTVEAEK